MVYGKYCFLALVGVAETTHKSHCFLVSRVLRGLLIINIPFHRLFLINMTITNHEMSQRLQLAPCSNQQVHVTDRSVAGTSHDLSTDGYISSCKQTNSRYPNEGILDVCRASIDVQSRQGVMFHNFRQASFIAGHKPDVFIID